MIFKNGKRINDFSSLENTINNYDTNIAKIFLTWALKNPRYLKSFFKLKRSYLESEKLRKKELSNGIKVPPFLIISITSKCNLNCLGCFACAAGNVNNSKQSNILDWGKWHSIICEAKTLGIFGFVIAGGEPFLFPDLLKLCAKFKDRFFIILTNGTALHNEDIYNLKKLGNVAVLVSIEGDKEFTDSRRGNGVFTNSYNTLLKMNSYGILCGVSITITKMNYEYWMDIRNIDNLINQGIKIGVFIEYIPLTPIDDLNKFHSSENSVHFKNENSWNIKSDYSLILSKDEREKFRKHMIKIREKKPIYIVHSPGDEEFFGGCVSAGRGFAHITPSGDLTPCPVSNIATHNLKKSSLREALSSKLFQEIRENENLLETDGLPCALFAHPREVDELAKKVGAYRTDK